MTDGGKEFNPWAYEDQKAVDSFNKAWLAEEIRSIVDKYIFDISKSSTVYNSKDVQNRKNFQIFQNVCVYVAEGVRLSEIYGFIDTSVFETGKAGLVFTLDGVYEKALGEKTELPYNCISEMQIKNGDLRFSVF